jgi:uncharacterized protein YbjT (DUF2867 family)
LVHKPDNADQVRALGAEEVVVADLADPASLDNALKGADGVFYMPPAFAAGESDLGLNIVAAALRASIRRFVFSSVIHPSLNLANHSAKIPVEDALYRSGMEFVVLHPAMFFQNLIPAWPAVLSTGVIAEPYSKSKRITRVDYRDVAEVAGIALMESTLKYGTFELCSRGATSREDIADVMSDVLGRKITAAEPAFEEWAMQVKLPYDDRQQKLMKKMYEHYGTSGERGNSETLRMLLKREPRTLRDFIIDLAVTSTPTWDI